MIKVTALPEFIIQREEEHTELTAPLSTLLRDISLSAKIVNREVNKAGLVDILGSAGTTNVQGEMVQKLDKFANERFIAAFQTGGECCGIASEEYEDFLCFEDHLGMHPKYLVTMDPLDGSSNIDVNVSVGTIFSIYSRLSESGLCTPEDFLQPGTEQVAAGYVIYGSSTMLVYTTGHGVNGFTLDPSIGEFCLSHPDIKIPKTGKIYSVNQGNYDLFEEGVKRYIDYCHESDPETNRPYSHRYIGSMVADIHRSLIKGGIFFYPATKVSPRGKLRLVYECNPMAFIVEQAGGRATDGKNRIVELKPNGLHDRVPIFIGSPDMVLKAEELVQKHKP
ncbi:MAG: class 1 fructose-bisphosphatase [Candidatus Dadabacteria bacterium]|nr:class 1 fructose-bisphosphatase [Candidatus Dadabacteria bacterium]